MRFIVSEEVFEKLGDVCFGVVVARGINNQVYHPAIGQFLDESIKSIEDKFAGINVKEAQEILPYGMVKVLFETRVTYKYCKRKVLIGY